MTEIKIDSSDVSVAELYKDFYAVPDFQREYVWQPVNVEKLLNDVHDEFYDGTTLVTGNPEYFIGSVVVCRDEQGTFQLIDGQQRLTTIYLVLCALRDALTAAGAESKALAEMIFAVSSDAHTGEDIERYRLTLQYEDSHDILEAIAAGSPSELGATATASMRNIYSAYEGVREFLAANFDGDAGRLKQFYAAFAQRVKLIRIVTPSLTHALKVFETINDRGVGLNAMDLLKNLLFMRTSNKDYPKLKERWKQVVDAIDGCGEKPLRFLRYFILSQYETDTSKPLREDEIYAWFSKNAEAVGITSDPLSFIGRLVQKAHAYANFAASKNAHGLPNRYLRNVALLSGAARQHFILLLAATNLNDDLFEQLCSSIENLFFVYIITREPTKNFERYFARWSGDLQRVQTADDLAAFVRRYLLPEMAQRSNGLDFAIGELSATRIQQYRLRYMLAKFTQYIEEKAWGNPSHAQLDHYTTSSVHIEHILSQTPSAELRAAFDVPDLYDEWTQRLGNLTLLEKTINTSVSNGSYDEKKAGYLQSAFLLTRSIVEVPNVGTNTQLNQAVRTLRSFDQWTSQSIGDRQELLVRLARRVWGMDDAISPASG